MKWLRALWKAILTFFGSVKADNLKEQQEAQQIQDEIVQESQHEIEKIPNATDDELDGIVIGTGLVMPTEDSDRSSRLEIGAGAKDICTRSATSIKTKQ
jgi:hypothetical protein